ncbi:hypothetical protein GALL_70950 [mine drainage metagenome]|uniref:Uncharacterized protein n=1 Tax=mine drainage metagenome TaxID=410659 RepID=A0A1J5SR58_9ZZZZ
MFRPVLLLLAFIFTVVLFPQRGNAAAFAPTLVYSAPAPLSIPPTYSIPTTVLNPAQIFLGATAFYIGMNAGYLIVDAICNGNATCSAATSNMRIPLTAANPVPAPAAAASVSTQSVTVYIGCGTTGTTGQVIAACAAKYPNISPIGYDPSGYLAFTMSNGCGGTGGVTTYQGTAYGTCLAPAFAGGITIGTSTSNSCPAGYVVSGSSCALSNARAAVPDSNCDMQRSGSALSMISDPDCTSPQQAMQLICDGTTFVCQGGGLDHLGNPYQISITPDSKYGGSNLSYTYQTNPSGLQTMVNTQTVTIDGTGTVTNVSQTQQPGTVSPGAQNTSNPASAVAPTTTLSNAPISFPTDYARQGEAAAAAATVSSKLDVLHNDLTATTSIADPVAPDSTTMPWFTNTFTNLLAWQLPAHTSTCPAPTFDLSALLGAGHLYTMDQHCQFFNNSAATIQSVFIICWTIFALFIVLRA